MRKEIVDLYRNERQDLHVLSRDLDYVMWKVRGLIAGANPDQVHGDTRHFVLLLSNATLSVNNNEVIVVGDGGKFVYVLQDHLNLPDDEPEGDSMEAVMAFRRRVRDAMVKVTRLHQEAVHTLSLLS